MHAEMSEMSSVDRKQKLELQKNDNEAVNKRHHEVSVSIKGGHVSVVWGNVECCLLLC